MTKTITLILDEDEAEIVASALEEDREGYIEAARDALAEGDTANGKLFGESADRIGIVARKVKALIGD